MSFINNTKRISLAVIIAQLISIVAVLTPASASAYNQISTRLLTLSDNTANNGSNSVTYTFTFTPAASTNIGVLAFKFCREDPLQGTTCTTPDGNGGTTMDSTAGGVTGSVAGQAGTTWTLNKATNGNPYFTGGATTTLTAGTTTVTLNNIKNPGPTSNGATYYARIWDCTGTTLCAENSAVDYGGLAWNVQPSTTVSAKVQETLNFCTYVTGTCAAPTSTNVNLGILSTSQITGGLSFMEANTNASAGYSIQYFGTTLTSGANTIAAKGSTAGALTAGVAGFGLNLATPNNSLKTPAGAAWSGSSAPTGTGSGAVNTQSTNYATTDSFAYAPATPAVLSAPGTTRNSQTIAYASAPTTNNVYTITYAAAISGVTVPGVYTATIGYVCTGVF